MNTHSTEAAQVPLIELLREVPTTARLQIDDGEFSTQYIPVGRYCHEAAAAISQHEADRARQEPVAGWSYESHEFGDVWARRVILNRPDGGANPPTKHNGGAIRNVRPLYTHPAPTNPAAQERETTLQRFNRHIEADAESPLERLRFFCSLAMTGQDWLDVEPFFTDVEAAHPSPNPSKPEQAEAPNILTDEGFEFYRMKHHLTSSQMIPIIEATKAALVQSDDTQRCIKARNKLNAALHGEGALIDDLEHAVANACVVIRRATLPPAIAAGDCGAGERDKYNIPPEIEEAIEKERQELLKTQGGSNA